MRREGTVLLLAALLLVLAGCRTQQRRRAELDGACTDPSWPNAYYLKGNVWPRCVPAEGAGDDMYCCPDGKAK